MIDGVYSTVILLILAAGVSLFIMKQLNNLQE